MKMIDVLDKGFVRLVDSMGSDLSIVRAARVSYNAAWRAGEDSGGDKRLINYLWRNNHTTPFEAVTFTFEVYAPIFVLRQWHRHRTQSYNELSARYKELPEVYYVPDPALIGKQSANNKQTRDQIDSPNYEAAALIDAACAESFNKYRDLLSLGVPRELARSVLPFATYSHMFVTLNLLSLLKFIYLRDHDHAQYEIRQYAQAMRELAKNIVPVTMEVYDA